MNGGIEKQCAAARLVKTERRRLAVTADRAENDRRADLARFNPLVSLGVGGIVAAHEAHLKRHIGIASCRNGVVYTIDGEGQRLFAENVLADGGCGLNVGQMK